MVAVSMVGMNPFDWKIREGYVKDEMPLPLPYTLGVDFVGQVASLGEGASRFKVGDRVMTMSIKLGAFAEYIVVDEKILARVPDSMEDVEAATLPIPIQTAWQSVHTAGEIKPGMKVLIQGASGTSGAFAIQFAKSEGAYVIGTASGKNREYVLSLGADEFIDYQKKKFCEKVKNVDLVLDYALIGSSDITKLHWKVLKKGGAIVSVADPLVTNDVPAGCRAFFPTILPDAERMEIIAKQITDGRFKTKVGKIYKRGQLLEAMDVSQTGGSTGRLVVDFKHE